MSTSGSSDFTRTRDQICSASARKIFAIRAGETMSAQMLNDFVEALNVMVKHWMTIGIHVWTVTEGVLIPQAAQIRYSLSSSSTDHAMLADDLVTTTLSGAEASGQTALSVTDDDGIADNDHLGVILDDGTVAWSAVNGTPSGNVVTVDDALTGAASSGNYVFSYTSKLGRPLKIVDARRYKLSSGLDTPLIVTSRLDYRALPNKTQTGIANQVFYDPQLSAGYLTLWQPPTTVTELIKFTHHRPIEDFDSAGNNPDLPTEWLQALIFNLALNMAPEFQVPRDMLEGPFGIGTLAARYLDEVAGFDREAESIVFGVDTDWSM